VGKIDNIKSRLGFGASWDSEYLEEGDQDIIGREDHAGEAAARSAYGGVGSTVSGKAAPTDPGAGDIVGERRYAQDSPFASGAAPSAVTKYVRKPDLKRVTEITGREIRETNERRYDNQPRVGNDGTVQIKPKEFSEAMLIANQLKDGRKVTIDLSIVDSGTRQRFIDFMAGLVYALDGHLARSSTNIYTLTPR